MLGGESGLKQGASGALAMLVLLLVRSLAPIRHPLALLDLCLNTNEACRRGWHAHTGNTRRFCVTALQLPASGEAADAPRGATEDGSAAEAAADELPASHPGAAVVPAETDGTGDSAAGEAAEA